jgi:hypothetical protein
VDEFKWNGDFFKPKKRTVSVFDINVFCLFLVTAMLIVLWLKF